jgi:hypothetical protein
MTEDEAVADAVRHGRIVEIGQAKVMPASLSAPKDDDDFSAAELHRIVADKNENPGAAAAAADMLWGNLRPRRVGPRTEANVDALSTDAINAILERTIRTTAAAREAAKRVAEWFGFEVSEPTRPRP